MLLKITPPLRVSQFPAQHTGEPSCHQKYWNSFPCCPVSCLDHLFLNQSLYFLCEGHAGFAALLFFSVGHESGHRCQVNIRMWLWSSKTLFYKVSGRWFALELIPGWDCYFSLLPQAPLLSSPFITGLIFNLLRTGHSRTISADFPASTIAFTWVPIG